MTKCPDCAQENIREKLFCQHCGRCLLPPDPQEVQLATAMHTEKFETPEGIGIYNGPIIKDSKMVWRRHQPVPSHLGGWLLVVNLVVLILVTQIAMYIFK